MSALASTSGPPWVKFKSIGDGVAGRIVSFEDVHDTEFETDPKKGVTKGDLKYFPSGDPIMFTRVILETIPGDETSQVTLDVKGKNMGKAVAGAFRRAGADDIEADADLSVAWTGMDGRAKAYTSEYAKPAVPAAEAEKLPVEDEPPF